MGAWRLPRRLAGAAACGAGCVDGSTIFSYSTARAEFVFGAACVRSAKVDGVAACSSLPASRSRGVLGGGVSGSTWACFGNVFRCVRESRLMGTPLGGQTSCEPSKSMLPSLPLGQAELLLTDEVVASIGFSISSAHTPSVNPAYRLFCCLQANTRKEACVCSATTAGQESRPSHALMILSNSIVHHGSRNNALSK